MLFGFFGGFFGFGIATTIETIHGFDDHENDPSDNDELYNVLKKFGMVRLSEVKSTPPAMRPTIGITMSLTRELTMAVKAPPTATPTARSITEPRLMNSINSLRKPLLLFNVFVSFSLARAALSDFSLVGFLSAIIYTPLFTLL